MKFLRKSESQLFRNTTSGHLAHNPQACLRYIITNSRFVFNLIQSMLNKMLAFTVIKTAKPFSKTQSWIMELDRQAEVDTPSSHRLSQLLIVTSWPLFHVMCELYLPFSYLNLKRKCALCIIVSEPFGIM